MEEVKRARACIFSPEGTYFKACRLCGCPSIQYFDRPGDTCIWCSIQSLHEDVPSDGENPGDDPIQHK